MRATRLGRWLVVLTMLSLAACGDRTEPAVTVKDTATTTTTAETTTSTAVRTWQPVKDCDQAEADRPGMLLITFWYNGDQADWTYTEAREAVVAAGASPAHMDRLGEAVWTNIGTSRTSMVGEVKQLQQIAARLHDTYPLHRDGPRGAQGHLYCANQDPGDHFVPDGFSVQLASGGDVRLLLERHGNLETEISRFDDGTNRSLFVRLRTSRPDQLFQRIMEYWHDPQVLGVEHTYIVRAGNTTTTGRS